MDRIDSRDKASGANRYVADIDLPEMCHVVFVRSTQPHARIEGIDVAAARAAKGVIGVFTAADVSDGTYGRFTRDIPLLARKKVRFVGERVAAVVAESRMEAEEAAALVDVSYEPLAAVFTAEEALADGAPAVDEEPWIYPKARVKPGWPANQLSFYEEGSREAVERCLAEATFLVDEVYTTQSVHQGYLETQATVADAQPGGKIRLWCTNKAPYGLRKLIGECLGIEPELIEIQPTPIGGDFGGKGSPGDAPVCVELSRLIGRPVKSVLHYHEDLTATNPRHPATIRMRVGADAEGRITAARMELTVNGGCYAGAKGSEHGQPFGLTKLPCYRIPHLYIESRSAYTNTEPRGNMRAPGSPQSVFAMESALDELAHVVGISPVELRERNLLRTGDDNAHGGHWKEHRGHEVIKAAAQLLEPLDGPPGWLVGTGIAIAAREDHANPATVTLRIIPAGEGIVVQLSSVETGTGSHTVLLQAIADELELPPDKITIEQVSTGELFSGLAAGGSTVTVALTRAARHAAHIWRSQHHDQAITVSVEAPSHDEVPVGSYTAQIAKVAVDPQTGQVEILEVSSVLDVADVVNAKAFQMQIDGGTMMGIGFATLEDLEEGEGQVWAANLGEYKLPSERDTPVLRTILLPGGVGAAGTNVKQVGESTTPPMAPAVANAIFNATGCRMRELPIRAEALCQALSAAPASVGEIAEFVI